MISIEKIQDEHWHTPHSLSKGLYAVFLVKGVAFWCPITESGGRILDNYG